MRDLLTLDTLSEADLTDILTGSFDLADAWDRRRLPLALAGRRVALILDDGGWRNTAALDLGAVAMGATVTHVPVTLSGRESVADLAGYLDNWFDLIAIRTSSLDRMRELADAARVPVVNLRTSSNHPCETLGDLAFVARQRGGVEALAGLRVVVVAPDANILGSWVEAAAELLIHVTQVYPARWHVTGPAPARFTATDDLSAIDGADVLITDCWPTGADATRLLPYQVTAALLDRLARGAHFIPCPPVTRGEEVSDAAMRHPYRAVPEAKAWLLHVQNAVLLRAIRDA